MGSYTIYTSGPILAGKRFASDEDARAYVERYAPLKRGWSFRWTVVPVVPERGAVAAWRCERVNSKGRVLPASYAVDVVRFAS